jgi:peroxidase
MATGRWDGTVSSMDAANAALPSSKSSVQQLTSQFGNKGLSQDEMVTLSGTVPEIHKFTLPSSSASTSLP